MLSPLRGVKTMMLFILFVVCVEFWLCSVVHCVPLLCEGPGLVLPNFNPITQRKEDLCEFVASLVYIASSSQPEFHRETLSQTIIKYE